jgi:hypothetical protein
VCVVVVVVFKFLHCLHYITDKTQFIGLYYDDEASAKRQVPDGCLSGSNIDDILKTQSM